MKNTFFLSLLALIAGSCLHAQQVFDPNIHSVKLFKVGDQTSFPVIALNSSDALELDFDDMGTDIKNYYYTFQLCNEDWSPSDMRPFEYIKGFQDVRITSYRNSSIALTRYTHYQAALPDRNCYPSLSGNYLLKVFLNDDTSQLVFTRKMVVVEPQSTIAATVQQPYNIALTNSFHRLNIQVQTTSSVNIVSPTDLHMVILQNNNWQTSIALKQPTISRGNYFEYNDDQLTSLPAGNEFRWIDLRSLRLMSDRMQRMEGNNSKTDVYVKPEKTRLNQPYLYYRDLDGAYTIETIESINPVWQGDYAYVHFSYFPPGNQPFEGRDLYIFGECTNYAADTSGRMVFNSEKGAYEKTLFLKQGYYNYLYVTLPQTGYGYPDMKQTEGNYWTTENNYLIFLYYRPFGSRSDHVIGFTSVSSLFQRQGL